MEKKEEDELLDFKKHSIFIDVLKKMLEKNVDFRQVAAIFNIPNQGYAKIHNPPSVKKFPCTHMYGDKS